MMSVILCKHVDILPYNISQRAWFQTILFYKDLRSSCNQHLEHSGLSLETPSSPHHWELAVCVCVCVATQCSCRPWRMSARIPHTTDAEADTERVSNLAKVTQVASSRATRTPCAVWLLRPCASPPCFTLLRIQIPSLPTFSKLFRIFLSCLCLFIIHIHHSCTKPMKLYPYKWPVLMFLGIKMAHGEIEIIFAVFVWFSL